MFGKLPIPKYLAHTIFKDNAAGSVAFGARRSGCKPAVQLERPGFCGKTTACPFPPICPKPPYDIGASIPTAWFNESSYGLDQVAVRKAIAMAVDYDTIIANAMTNQSATFEQVPAR